VKKWHRKTRKFVVLFAVPPLMAKTMILKLSSKSIKIVRDKNSIASVSGKDCAEDQRYSLAPNLPARDVRMKAWANPWLDAPDVSNANQQFNRCVGIELSSQSQLLGVNNVRHQNRSGNGGDQEREERHSSEQRAGVERSPRFRLPQEEVPRGRGVRADERGGIPRRLEEGVQEREVQEKRQLFYDSSSHRHPRDAAIHPDFHLRRN